jgi:ankyrin repeat protein
MKLGLARSHAGATPLHYAAGAGASAKAIKAIHEAGQMAVRTFSLKGGTPLHWACATPAPKNFSETISALLDCGADINASQVDDSQMIPPSLVMALAAGNDLHAKCLFGEAKNREIDLRPSLEFNLPGQLSPYHVAADMNMVGTLALLLESLDKNATVAGMMDDRGLTPLDLAAREGHVGCVLLLLPVEKQTEEEALRYINVAQSKNWNDGNAVELPSATETVPASDILEITSIEARAKADSSLIAASSSDVSAESKRRAQEKKEAGNLHFGSKEWEAALDFYTQAISFDPSDAAFYSNRSACYMNINDPEKALYDATMARCFRPDWPKAAFRMAVARLELGKFEEAAISAWEGLQQDQENEELKRLLQKCVNKGRKDFRRTKT